MKVYLCGEKGCCPAVEIGKSDVKIGEEGNMCTLKKNEWTALKKMVIKGKI